MHYYKRIRELREEMKMTQRELGGKLGMPQTQYIRYENGSRDTPTAIIVQLAKLYQVSTDYILGITDEKKPYPPLQIQIELGDAHHSM